jgi:hypothetical protein
MKARPALSNDNVAGLYYLTTVELHAESFLFRIASVYSTSASIIICHCR